MEFMLDTLNLDEIKKWSEILPLAGVTSNPTIAKREGSINFFERIKDVRELIGSTPSIHVQVISQDFEGILKDAHEIRRQAGDDIFIKVPVTPAGLRAIKVLKKEATISLQQLFIQLFRIISYRSRSRLPSSIL